MLSCMKRRVILYLPNGTAQVLAFRGTSDAKDIGADITLGLGKQSSTRDRCRKYYA